MILRCGVAHWSFMGKRNRNEIFLIGWVEETWVCWGILEMVWKTGLANNKATLLGNKVVFMADKFGRPPSPILRPHSCNGAGMNSRIPVGGGGRRCQASF